MIENDLCWCFTILSHSCLYLEKSWQRAARFQVSTLQYLNEVPGSRVGILKGAELTAIVVIREAISQTLISIPGYESPNSIALVLHQSPR